MTLLARIILRCSQSALRGRNSLRYALRRRKVFWASSGSTANLQRAILAFRQRFDLTRDPAHRVKRILNDVGVGERMPDFLWQAGTDNSEERLQSLHG